MLTLDTKIKEIQKVGPTYLKRLQQLKIKNIRDLFFHFPHRYDDFRQIVSISQLKEGQKATIKGEIVEIKNVRLFHKRMVLTEALVKDKSGTIKVIWFNQPYLTQTLKKGKIVNFSGKLSFVKKTLCLSNPVHEIAQTKETTHTGRLVPIYHETAGLSSRYLRYLIKPLLPLINQITDFLPEPIKRQFKLVSLSQAIKQIHFPNNHQSAQAARQRLAFDELFLIQLTTLKQRQKLAQEKALTIPFNQKLIKSFVKDLPFKLTNNQRIAAWQIFQDLAKKKPMNRLLNGDVGSGKTVVAIMAGLEIAKAGYQVALMAPTEILAKQHFQTFKDFLKKSNLKIALLTRTEAQGLSLKDRPQGTVPKGQSLSRPRLKKEIIEGKIDIVIGTHAYSGKFKL